MRVLYGLVAVILLGAGGYFLYQQPQVRVLFETEEAPENPLEFLENIPEPEIPEPKPEPRRTPRRQPAPAPAPAVQSADQAIPAGENQVPNSEVGRTLMQILAARKLASGLSLSVTDQEIALHGSVESREQLSQILEILEKGREYRRINTDDVVIE